MFNQKRPQKTELVNAVCKSMTIRGDVTGDEDLVIDGRVEGDVRVDDHHVTVAGTVVGDVRARNITILGHVRGNVTATELVELRETSNVEGDVLSRRFAIEENASLNGCIRTHQSTSEHPNLSLVKGAAPAPAAGKGGPHKPGHGKPAPAHTHHAKHHGPKGPRPVPVANDKR